MYSDYLLNLILIINRILQIATAGELTIEVNDTGYFSEYV